jgi:hypothetical protein
MRWRELIECLHTLGFALDKDPNKFEYVLGISITDGCFLSPNYYGGGLCKEWSVNFRPGMFLATQEVAVFDNAFDLQNWLVNELDNYEYVSI